MAPLSFSIKKQRSVGSTKKLSEGIEDICHLTLAHPRKSYSSRFSLSQLYPPPCVPVCFFILFQNFYSTVSVVSVVPPISLLLTHTHRGSFAQEDFPLTLIRRSVDGISQKTNMLDKLLSHFPLSQSSFLFVKF